MNEHPFDRTGSLWTSSERSTEVKHRVTVVVNGDSEPLALKRTVARRVTVSKPHGAAGPHSGSSPTPSGPDVTETSR